MKTELKFEYTKEFEDKPVTATVRVEKANNKQNAAGGQTVFIMINEHGRGGKYLKTSYAFFTTEQAIEVAKNILEVLDNQGELNNEGDN